MKINTLLIIIFLFVYYLIIPLILILFIKNAKVINSDEVMNLISNIRLGVSIKELNDISYEKINSLIINTQPATLSIFSKKELNATERDIKRASFVQSII